MERAEDADRSTAAGEARDRLEVVLGARTSRYLSVADAARASGFSDRAVYRAIERGDLSASLVCSRLRIHPEDFLMWVEGERAAVRYRPRPSAVRSSPASNGLRSLMAERDPAA